MSMSCDRIWESRKRSSPFREAVSFLDNRLVLGRATLLLSLDAVVPGLVTLKSDAAYDRMVALLKVAGRGRLEKSALSQLDASLDDLRRGDRALAAIRLAFAPLPRIRDHDDAYRLFLAETALDAGLRPTELLRELGYEGCTPLLKFDQNQLRVPAGSDRGGQWTSAGAGGGAPTTGHTPTSGAAKPSSGGEDGATVIPVLVRPEGGDMTEFGEKWRRLGFGESKEEQFEDGHLFVHPAPMIAVPPAFFLPGTSTVTTPSPTLAPVGGVPKPAGATTRDDEGSACPKQENDRPNGPNLNGDEFEYEMSLRINPENPTPKYSMATPDVTSQAYYLTSPTPTGQTSFDDCKQSDTPIPGLRPGDLFELKAPGWGWQIFAIDSAGDQQFSKQVENQNAAVVAEGRGRQIYYCLGNQAVVDQAQLRFGKPNQNSHFLVCH